MASLYGVPILGAAAPVVNEPAGPLVPGATPPAEQPARVPAGLAGPTGKRAGRTPSRLVLKKRPSPALTSSSGGRVDAAARRYKKGKVLGKGISGVVYRAEQQSLVAGEGPRSVAIKVMDYGDNTPRDIEALREIKFLSELVHPNVSNLEDCYKAEDKIHLVFQLASSYQDLNHVIGDKGRQYKGEPRLCQPAHIKTYMWSILGGLEFLHRNWVLHRDIKPANVLVMQSGLIKLTDFGLARSFGFDHIPHGQSASTAPRQYTPNVVTAWYRCPELLLGARLYGPAVDQWAVGVIFAELMRHSVGYLDPGHAEGNGMGELAQLRKIFSILGTPSQDTWPDFNKLPRVVNFKPLPRTDLVADFLSGGAGAASLLDQLLLLDPKRRLTARDALAHEYFSAEPRALSPGQLQALLRAGQAPLARKK